MIIDKTFTYRDHKVIVYGYDHDEDGVSQSIEVFVDGIPAHIENGSITPMIKKWIDDHFPKLND